MNSKQEVVGQYQLLEKIHECMRCQIWKSKTLSDNKIVAIKKLQKKILLNQSVDLRQVTREVQILYKIQVEGVLNLLDYFENETNSFIVFEFCQQGNLEELLNQGLGYFSEVIATEFLKKILKLVYNLHFYPKGTILHRNLSLKCVLFDKYGIIKLTSLRLICLIEGQRQEKLNGTITDINPYNAPEVISQHKFSMKSDMWSIGVLFYKLLLGEYPFEGKLDNLLYNDIMKKASKIKKQVEVICKNKKIDKFSPKTMQILEGFFKVNDSQRYSWKELNEVLQLNLPVVRREDLQVKEDTDIREKVVGNLIKPQQNDLTESIIPDFKNMPSQLLESINNYENQLLPSSFINSTDPKQICKEKKFLGQKYEELRQQLINQNQGQEQSNNPQSSTSSMMVSRINKFTSSAYKQMEKSKHESLESGIKQPNKPLADKHIFETRQKKKENDLNLINTSCESVYMSSEIQPLNDMHQFKKEYPVVTDLNLQSPSQFQKKQNNQINSEREIQTSIQFHLSRIQSSSKIKKTEQNEKEIQTGQSLVFNQAFTVVSISKDEKQQQQQKQMLNTSIQASEQEGVNTSKDSSCKEQKYKEKIKKQAENYMQQIAKLYEKGPQNQQQETIELCSETLLNEQDRSFSKKEMYLNMSLKDDETTDLQEWKINQYMQKVMMNIEALFKCFGTTESLHGCIVLLNMYRMRIIRILKDCNSLAQGEQELKNSESILKTFLQKSKIKLSLEEMNEDNPITFQIYRQELFKLFNQLIQLITESQYQEQNKIVEEQYGIKPIPVEITLQYSKLAYHILILAYYTRVFNGIYKKLIEQSDNIYDDIEEALKDKDLLGLLKLRKQLKIHLNIV